MKLRYQVVLGWFLATALAFMSYGCDRTTSFTFVNETDSTIVATYTILEEGGDPRPLAENSYRIKPHSSVDTGEEESLSGDTGSELFGKHDIIRIRAESGKESIFDRTFTYAEAKALRFRFVIDERVPE